MSIKKEFKRVFAVYSDTHVGSAFGILPPGYMTEEGNIVEQNEGQRKLWEFWLECEEICNEWSVDTVFLVGDLVQGLHRRDFGAGNVLVGLQEQSRATIQLFSNLCAKRKVYGVSGTDYHDAQEIKVEKNIIESLGGMYCGYVINCDIVGTKRKFNIMHGSSHSVIYRETVAAREILFMREAESLGKLDHFDIIIRAHSHFFRHLDLPKCHYIINPCWQVLRPDNYTAKNYAKYLPDIGFVLVAIDSKDRQHILHFLMEETIHISDYTRSV